MALSKLWHPTLLRSLGFIETSSIGLPCLLDVQQTRSKHKSTSDLRRQLNRLQNTTYEQERLKAEEQAAAQTEKDRLAEASNPDKVALSVLSSHNSSLPYLEGSTVRGTIVELNRRTVKIDAGLSQRIRFFRSELLVNHVVESTAELERTGPEDLRIGDVIHFTLETLQTPFGEPALLLNNPKLDKGVDMVLEELAVACGSGTPVKGRMLNPLPQGFAIGFAGVVAFCPARYVPFHMSRQVATLSDYKILSMRRQPLNIVAVPWTEPISLPGAWSTFSSGGDDETVASLNRTSNTVA